jgi:hypothetical protein
MNTISDVPTAGASMGDTESACAAGRRRPGLAADLGGDPAGEHGAKPDGPISTAARMQPGRLEQPAAQRASRLQIPTTDHGEAERDHDRKLQKTIAALGRSSAASP